MTIRLRIMIDLFFKSNPSIKIFYYILFRHFYGTIKTH